MTDYGPQITAARLYRKTSKSGTTYFVGRIGMLKAALLKSKETADDGSEIWNLVLSEAPAKPSAPGPADKVSERTDPTKSRQSRSNPKKTTAPADARPFDDPIPLLGA